MGKLYLGGRDMGFASSGVVPPASAMDDTCCIPQGTIPDQRQFQLERQVGNPALSLWAAWLLATGNCGMRKFWIAAACVLMGMLGAYLQNSNVPERAWAGITCSLPVVLVNGTTADASQVM